jgi:hypothetical protein
MDGWSDHPPIYPDSASANSRTICHSAGDLKLGRNQNPILIDYGIRQAGCLR